MPLGNSLLYRWWEMHFVQRKEHLGEMPSATAVGESASCCEAMQHAQLHLRGTQHKRKSKGCGTPAPSEQLDEQLQAHCTQQPRAVLPPYESTAASHAHSTSPGTRRNAELPCASHPSSSPLGNYQPNHVILNLSKH